MTLAADLAAAVDGLDPVAVDSLNSAIDAINATRTAIAAALSEVGDAAAVKAHISAEEVTLLDRAPKGNVPKAVTKNSGPAAMFGIKQAGQG